MTLVVPLKKCLLMGICNQAGVSPSGTTIASKQGVASVNTCSELTLFLSDQLRREPRVLGLRLHLSPRVRGRKECSAEQSKPAGGVRA